MNQCELINNKNCVQTSINLNEKFSDKKIWEAISTCFPYANNENKRVSLNSKYNSLGQLRKVKLLTLEDKFFIFKTALDFCGNDIENIANPKYINNNFIKKLNENNKYSKLTDNFNDKHIQNIKTTIKVIIDFMKDGTLPYNKKTKNTNTFSTKNNTESCEKKQILNINSNKINKQKKLKIRTKLPHLREHTDKFSNYELSYLADTVTGKNDKIDYNMLYFLNDLSQKLTPPENNNNCHTEKENLNNDDFNDKFNKLFTEKNDNFDINILEN